MTKDEQIKRRKVVAVEEDEVFETITLRLEKSSDEELTKIQEELGVSKHSLILLMIANYLRYY